MAGGLGYHDAASRPPAESAAHPPRRAGPSDEALGSDNSHDATLLTGRGTSAPPADQSQTGDGAGGDYDTPDRYANLDELSAQGPVDRGQRPSLDQTQGSHRGTQEKSGGGDVAAAAVVVSRRLTQLYTHSYLVFFALMGVLARLGLTALTRFVDTPVLFTTIWANFGGSLVMGFLAEDRMLFRHEWGTTQQQPQKRDEDDAEHGRQAATTTAAAAGGGYDPAAAKKAHLACKKTIPLYVGLTTGFCGSFTSFSTFMRDAFLATSNDMVAPGLLLPGTPPPPPPPPPRSGGYSFMALLAVVITTVALSLSGLVLQGVEDGFCGCLTTVSTWVAELAALKRRSAYVYGAASILVSFAAMVLIMGGLRWTDGWAALQC
ncbi:Camphor resistance CrcB protein [Moelleriella libera RCEF 2490]|uniref:Camphor resistance CrcB protein n=1 Tax=Moelleriella libera RCEF 2490 TaxID=1081109 RepID=A0A167Y4L5_9HYPO|nr:Camphor resistance CrcB protein [Moelleriella libera RCEF 2490]